MPDNSVLIEVSAFSGLAGALISQAFSGFFAYLGDKRKAKNEALSFYRAKRMEVAENFYYVNGETMAVLKKSVEVWKDGSKPRTESSIEFLNKEVKKLNVYLEKLNAENWKQNLIGLYFNINLSHDKVIHANNRSHALYLKLLDLRTELKSANTKESQDRLYGLYYTAVFDLCAQYEAIYVMLKEDTDRVKAELIRSFETG